MALSEFEQDFICVHMAEQFGIQQEDDTCKASGDGHELWAAYVLSSKKIAKYACHEHSSIEN